MNYTFFHILTVYSGNNYLIYELYITVFIFNLWWNGSLIILNSLKQLAIHLHVNNLVISVFLWEEMCLTLLAWFFKFFLIPTDAKVLIPASSVTENTEGYLWLDGLNITIQSFMSCNFKSTLACLGIYFYATMLIKHRL